MTLRSALATIACLSLAAPAFAQSTGGAISSATPALTITPQVTTIQPATTTSQVRQAPQNSAMRNSAGGGQSGAARTANPMGMAGMGSGSTGGMTLSSGGSSGGTSGSSGNMMQSGSSRQSAGAMQGGQSQVRITDTGVIQRTPTSRQGSR